MGLAKEPIWPEILRISLSQKPELNIEISLKIAGMEFPEFLHAGVRLEVIVTIVIVSWLISPDLTGRIQKYLYRGDNNPFAKYQQDIPVDLQY